MITFQEIQELKEFKKETLEFLRDLATNYDCDSDGHKYNTGCRACEAEALYNKYKEK